ncbi:DUF3363 domain-containing protein [Sphingopyxis sp.]|uniref:DUF3363 domain-containing protein n=1 Tax=Sphingopyxis sp. TaxID=1908224 RepID=UPI003F6E7573
MEATRHFARGYVGVVDHDRHRGVAIGFGDERAEFDRSILCPPFGPVWLNDGRRRRDRLQPATGPIGEGASCLALQRRELLRLARLVARETGKRFSETKSGEPVEGKLARRIDAAGGRYALVEKAKEFTLVPWRPALERHIGKDVGGMMRERGINWTFGRERGGPSIT